MIQIPYSNDSLWWEPIFFNGLGTSRGNAGTSFFRMALWVAPLKRSLTLKESLARKNLGKMNFPFAERVFFQMNPKNFRRKGVHFNSAHLTENRQTWISPASGVFPNKGFQPMGPENSPKNRRGQ